jgi:hypothetical protein
MVEALSEADRFFWIWRSNERRRGRQWHTNDDYRQPSS